MRGGQSELGSIRDTELRTTSASRDVHVSRPSVRALSLRPGVARALRTAVKALAARPRRERATATHDLARRHLRY